MINEISTSGTHAAGGSWPVVGGREWLIAAIGIASALHLITVARSPLIAPDGIGFIGFARELADDPLTAIRSHAQHPGYPLLILGTHAVTERLVSGDAGWEFAARLACGISGLACVALVWILVRQVVDQSAANTAAVIFSVLPMVRQNAADALSDSPHLALSLWAVCLVCNSAMSPSWWRLLHAGAASGLAFWVRPEGLAVALVSTFCMIVVPAWRVALGTRRALFGSMILLGGAALTVAPLVMISGKLTGKLAGKQGWQQIQRPAAAATGLPSVQPPKSPQDPHARQVPVVQVPGVPTPWNDPLPAAAAAAISRLGTALAEVLHGILFLPLLVGIPLAARRMSGTSFTVCLMLALSQVGMLLLLYWMGGYIDRRHLLPLVAILMPSIGIGTLAIGEWLTRPGEHRRGGVWPALAVAVCVLAVLVPRSIRPLHQSHLHKLRAAAWLRQHGQRNDVVGSNAVEVVYHASIDGGARPGSLLRYGYPIDAHGPLLQNTFLVVELDEGNALPAWSSGIPSDFTPVQRIIGDPVLRQRDLVIYQRGRIMESVAVPEPIGAMR